MVLLQSSGDRPYADQKVQTVQTTPEISKNLRFKKLAI